MFVYHKNPERYDDLNLWSSLLYIVKKDNVVSMRLVHKDAYTRVLWGCTRLCLTIHNLCIKPNCWIIVPMLYAHRLSANLWKTNLSDDIFIFTQTIQRFPGH